MIDMATSVVPWGKVEEMARTGDKLLPGWAIGQDGHDDCDPRSVL